MAWHNYLPQPPQTVTHGLHTLALSFLGTYLHILSPSPGTSALSPVGAVEANLLYFTASTGYPLDCHYKGEFAANHTHFVYPSYQSLLKHTLTHLN